MSLLRKKYYSIQVGDYIDVPTTPNLTFNSSDISNIYNDETIRLIKFGSEVNSSKIDEMISDLVFNDKLLFDSFQKINSLLSNGTFYSIGDNFDIYDIQKVEYLDGTYIESFGIKSGQIKYNDEVIFLEPLKNYKTITDVASGVTNVITLNSIVNLSVGSVIFGSEFQSGTTIETININNKQITLSKNISSDVLPDSLVLFMDIPTFTVGEDIDEISSSGSYPVWRRDLISYDITNSSWEVTKGVEILNIPPINTQLDVIYQIESILYVSEDKHKIKLSVNNRDITNDFTTDGSSYAKVNLSNNKAFDGLYQVTDIDTINNAITVRIPTFRDDSKNQISSGGYIDLKKIGIISILVYKASASAPSLIFDQIEKVAPNSGITGGIQDIIRAQIEPDVNYYNIKSNDFVHLVDIEGRLLDWEEGQGINVLPELGYTYEFYQNNLDHSQFQVPFPAYAGIETGYLTNVPFILQEATNNVFGISTIDLVYLNIGIKNTPISIGQEGLEYRITNYNPISDELSVASSTSQKTNNIITKTTINNPAINFNNIGINLTRKDFILITSGKGYYQVGKISNFGANFLEVINLSKELDSTSKFIIFNNTLTEIIYSSNFVTNDYIRGQVLSGINGVFGQDSVYSKVQLPLGDQNDNVPKISLKKWYFLNLKAYTEDNYEQGSPYIVIENITNSSIPASSAFIEVFYRTISGKYPSGNLLIEDEFGDIYTDFPGRAESPHFRPTKYQVIARALDRNLNYPQDTDEVFVDTHTGKIKFHPLSKPRKVFVSYNKLDVLDGNSTDFSIKHIDVETGLKTNVQDKISEIDSRFNNQTEIKKTWLVNGLISKEDSGFLGPFKVDEDNTYNIIYKDTTFENFTFDEDNYMVKFSNHQYDNPVYIGENNVILDNLNLVVTNPNTNFISSELISEFDFLDYEAGVSGATLPQVGYNSYDEYFVPVSEYFLNDLSLFYQKKRILETPNYKSEMFIDTGLYSPDFGVDGNWNYLYSSYFNKNNVLYGLLRKSNYEDLLINANPKLKRRFRQREFIKLLDTNFNDINTDKSQTQIISEKFLSKSLILDNIKYKENYLQLKAEITQYKDYKFLTAQDINGDTLNLTNRDHNIDSTAIIIPTVLKKSSVFINNSLITVYISQLTSSPYYKLINFSKTKEIQDIDTISTYSLDTLIEDINIFEIKSCVFNDNYIAIAYVYQDNISFYIKIKVYSIINNQLVLLSGSEQSVGTINANYYFNIYQVANNKISIVWKKSENEIGLVIYNYSIPIETSSLTDVRIIENQYSLISDPSITHFGKDNFIVGYSNLVGAKLKIFDLQGNLLFFNTNVDYRTLTTTNIPIVGNLVKILELNTNDIAIVFLDKQIDGTKYNLKLVILDSWTKNWKYPLNSENTSQSLSVPLIVDYDLTETLNSVSISLLNEDIFCVSYIKNTKINLKAFKNDGSQVFHSYENNTLSNYLIETNRIGDSSIIITHIVSSSSTLNFSIYNFRPDFTLDSRVNTAFEVANYSTNDLYKLFNFETNNFIAVIQSSSNLQIKIINTDGKEKHYQNTYYSPLNLTLTSITKMLDIEYITFNYENQKIKMLLVLWSNGTAINLDFIKITNNSIINCGRLPISTNITNYSKNFGKIIHVNDTIIGIILRNTSNYKYNIQGVDLDIFKTANSFGTPQASNYTVDMSTVYNPTQNVLSGTYFDESVYFYEKDTTDGFLFYPSYTDTMTSGTMISKLIKSDNYFTNEQLTLQNLVVEQRYVLQETRQYSEINFAQDNTNSDTLFALGNSSGIGYYHKINFDENNEISTTFSTGILNISSGTTIASEVNIFNSTEDNHLILIYNEIISDVNNYKISFFNKNNFIITPTKPINLFSETNRGSILKSKKSNSSDIYLMFTSGNKILSKTYSSIFNDNFEDEIVYIETDSLGVSRNRIYNDMSLKINGINWRGQQLKQIPIASVNSLNLDSTQIDSDGVFRSDFFNISAHLVSTSKDSFSIIYYYHKEKDTDIAIKLRNYVVSRNRIFIDSNWIIGSSDLIFEGNNKDIHLRAIQHNQEEIFYIWYDIDNRIIKKTIVNKYNQTIAGTYEDVLESSGSNWVIIRGDRLIEGWITVLAYNLDTSRFYTLLFAPTGELQRFGNPFSLPFNITNTLTSNVTINEFGYFMWLYLDEYQNLRYYQHGFDGDPWGITQIVGRNYLGHLESTSNSPVENNLFNSSDFKFLQYNKKDVTIISNQIIAINEIYKIQETGFYRILCVDNPLINITFGLLSVTDQEPIITIDTSSSYVSTVYNTDNKINIYLSSSSILTFQNKLGKTLRFRFYKEN